MEQETKHVENHFEPESKCQVFTGNNIGCTFAMPGASVTQNTPVSEISKESPSGIDAQSGQSAATPPVQKTPACNEKLFKYVHPAILDDEEWQIHKEVKNLVTRQGIQEICQYLSGMESEKKIFLPETPAPVYDELVRMGMPDGDGFTLKTFSKYYKKKAA